VTRSRAVIGVVSGLALVAVGIWGMARLTAMGSRPTAARPHRVDPAARRRLESIPLYGGLAGTEALVAASLESGAALHVGVDLKALAAGRPASAGVPRLSELVPSTADGIVADDRESWRIDGPSPLLALLDRSAGPSVPGPAWEAVPGKPQATLQIRLLPSRLADPSLGGDALAVWRDRVEFAEKLLGRPLRRELAQDLAGPAVLALYDTGDVNEAGAVLAVELQRTDRVAALLETLFELGALTEQATIHRYRGVATGSFTRRSGGPGLALGVDGSLLLAATSRARLEAAIDARRDAPASGTSLSQGHDLAASWSAKSSSAFVAHAWSRLARASGSPSTPTPTRQASLRPEGGDGWRLVGRGAPPALAADPLIPLLRSVAAPRQRDGG
jgi:hypothetical protein